MEAAPRFRSERCASCSNEVLVDFLEEEGVAHQCEYCSGREKGYHQKVREEREERRRQQIQAGDLRFAERVGAVMGRTALDLNRPGALGRCPTCSTPFVLIDGRIAHSPVPCHKKEKL